jgi:hypothetical protein
MSVAVSIALLFSVLVAGCSQGTLSSSASPSPSPSPTPVPNSTTISQIQQLGGWDVCLGTCAGTGMAVSSITQGIASPSLSGNSARYQMLSGSEPFSGALWFNHLGSFDSATHFVYDLFFYVDNPSAAQALEFGVGQSANGNRYRYYTQCLLVGGPIWRVWNPSSNAWVASSVPCATPVANTWNHLIWEFQRDSSGNVIFIAVSVNGVRSPVNMSMPHDSDTGSGVDASFQPDANLNATPYSVWLDNVTVTLW